MTARFEKISSFQSDVYRFHQILLKSFLILCSLFHGVNCNCTWFLSRQLYEIFIKIYRSSLQRRCLGDFLIYKITPLTFYRRPQNGWEKKSIPGTPFFPDQLITEQLYQSTDMSAHLQSLIFVFWYFPGQLCCFYLFFAFDAVLNNKFRLLFISMMKRYFRIILFDYFEMIFGYFVWNQWDWNLKSLDEKLKSR